jgi:hypothetical protein
MRIAILVLLAAGDTLIFVFFAVQGRATHDLPLGTSPVITILQVAAPFAVPWFLVAALLGAFRTGIVARPKRMLLTTAVAWIIAGSIGLAARWLILGRAPIVAFAAAALGINGALLLAWRGAFSFIAARRMTMR